MNSTKRNIAGAIGAIGIAVATSVLAGTGTAQADTATTLSCHTDNPFPWMPAFDYRLTAHAGTVPNSAGEKSPGIFITGTSDNPNISPAPFLPYGTFTTVNWMNTTSHVNGAATGWTGGTLPNIDIAGQTGAGHVVFQVLPETSAVARFINTKPAVCQAEIDVP